MENAVSPPPRRVNRVLLWITIAVTVIGWAPAVLASAAGAFAQANGCVLNEGDAHPCIVGGHDFGSMLYEFFVMGWMMLLTWPLMLVAIPLWIVILVQALSKPRARYVPPVS